jgi:AraC-like DNA-binding protein
LLLLRRSNIVQGSSSFGAAALAMGAIPSSILDTARLPPRERFSAWRDALAATHQATLPHGCEPERFDGLAQAWNLGTALVVAGRATQQCLRRTPAMIRADQVDHYFVRLQKAGRWIGDVDGRHVESTTGMVTVFDMSRPTDGRSTAIENISFVLPRDALDDLLPPFDMHGLTLHDGLAALLRTHLIELVEILPSLDLASARRVTDATINLIAACVAPSRDATERARAPLEFALATRVRRYVDRHLCSPELSPRTVSKALGLSRSTLYAICEPRGGVAAFIQKRRLDRVHAILADPRDRRPITEIAEQHGFASLAHFSRAFRRAFGYSPREAREAGIAGRARVGADRTSGAPNSYRTWIREL